MDQSNKLSAPIPGMSLTTEPGNRPWENPPKYVEVEDVIQHYVPIISEDDKADQLMTLLEEGVAVNFLVENLVTAGTMAGLHTLESGILAGPVLAEVIKAMAEIEEIDYLESYDELVENKPKPAMVNKAMKQLADLEEAKGKEEPAPMEEAMEEKPKKRGIAIIASAAPVAMDTEVEEDGV